MSDDKSRRIYKFNASGNNLVRIITITNGVYDVTKFKYANDVLKQIIILKDDVLNQIADIEYDDEGKRSYKIRKYAKSGKSKTLYKEKDECIDSLIEFVALKNNK